MSWQAREGFLALVRRELLHLAVVNSSSRSWQMPLCAALSTGFPLLVGAYFQHLDYGLVSSLGGLVFLYSPNTPMSHRMVVLMACAFGLSGCYALGVLSHFVPFLMVPVLALIAVLVTMICRFYFIGPPGSLFFIMAAAIGAYSPLTVLQVPLFVGLQTLGTVQAVMIAFIYGVHAVRQQAPAPAAPPPQPTFDFVVLDSILIGLFVGLSLLLALALHLERAYWVPTSCLAVMQGASLRAVWTKQVHRIVGTGVGLLLTWGLLQLPLNPWSISLTMMVLAFVIECLVVRHYGLAAVFITPLTILLVEAGQLRAPASDTVLLARMLDIALGSVVGFLGGVCLHRRPFRDFFGRQIRRLAQAGKASGSVAPSPPYDRPSER